MAVLGTTAAATGFIPTAASAQPSPRDRGQEVVAGTFLEGSGAPARGAEVVLYAWPSGDVTRTHVVGDTVTLQPVARAVTDASGAFELAVDDPSSLRPFTDRSGVVNFEVIGRAGQGTGSFDFSRRLDSSGSMLTEMSTSPRGPQRAEVARATLQADRAARQQAQPGADASAEAATGAEAMDKACHISLKQDYGPRWDLVGQTYSTTTGVVHDFVYTGSASSTLGVGYSVSGSAGSWKQSGTSTYSSSTELAYPAAGDNTGRYYRTQFLYGKYFYSCSYSDGSYDQYYKARPYSWAASTGYYSVGAPYAPYCGSQLAGATVTKSSSSAVNWTNGLDIDYYIGIDLSSQTGYSSAAKVTFKFNSSRKLCGTQDYPGGTPRQLVAKS